MNTVGEEKSKSLKIAMLGHKRIPSREGGIEIVVEKLGERMVRLNHKVTCYNRQGRHVSGARYSESKVRKQFKGIKIKSVLTIDFKGLAAISSSVCASILCAFSSYDVIHFHAEGPCAMLWLPHLIGKRCIATIHGLDHQREKWGNFARQYILLGEKIAVRYADEIIVLSKAVQDYFLKTYNRETILIPNGVERPIIKDANLIKEKYNIDKDEYILFLGRIVPEKGLRYLIEAYKNVITDKKLVIAGGSSDTELFLEELKTLSREDQRVVFTGFVQGEVLEELYSNAYFYVFPSDLEGMPISLLEAMSYGNCCLVSDIPECTEVVEANALIFKKGDIESLREKIQEACLSKKLVETYKKNVADFVCEKYNWDSVVRKTLDIYQG